MTASEPKQRAWTLSRKGLLIVAVPIAFQIVVLVVIAIRSDAETRYGEAELRSQEVFASAYRILGLLVDVETAIRGYALTGAAPFTEPYDRAMIELPKEFARFRAIAAERHSISAAQIHHDALPVIVHQRRNRALIDNGRRNETIAVVNSQVGKRYMDRFRATMHEFLEEERALGAQRRRDVARARSRSTAALITGFSVNLGLAVALALYFTRNIARRLAVIVDNTARLQRDEPLNAPLHGHDELALLDRRFHRMAATLAKNRRELLETNEELESFSYSVSHDLRAPLRAINGYAQMLEEDYALQLEGEGTRFLGVIRKEAQRLGRLIDDLLAFSRLGRKALSNSEIDMAELAHDSFAEVAAASTARLIVDDDLPPAAGDQTLIRQVLVNLFANAVKFSSNREDVTVELHARRDGAMNEYCVRDYGVGFDMRFADKLFGVFQRLHSDTEFRGTGVGLAIVRRIIRRHDGDVRAESQPGKGATFYFTLPAHREDS
ncbi:MAG TPA: ATP-binding protein [Thermoanaerobaculia bacterium]